MGITMTLWTIGLLPTPSGEVFGTFCATQDENQSAKTEASSAAEKLVANTRRRQTTVATLGAGHAAMNQWRGMAVMRSWRSWRELWRRWQRHCSTDYDHNCLSCWCFTT
jgi:hypothetical protein